MVSPKLEKFPYGLKLNTHIFSSWERQAALKLNEITSLNPHAPVKISHLTGSLS